MTSGRVTISLSLCLGRKIPPSFSWFAIMCGKVPVQSRSITTCHNRSGSPCSICEVQQRDPLVWAMRGKPSPGALVPRKTPILSVSLLWSHHW